MFSHQLVLVLASLLMVNGHIGMWHPSLYGWDPNDPNQSDPVTPLMNLPFSQWWFHGYINKPPAPDTYLSLPAGGTLHAEVACNKALTSYGQNPAQQTGIYACDGTGPTGGIGAMHTSDAWETPVDQLKDVKGCGIAIAYESDVTKIQPEDFAVISTNYTCPWFKHVDFQIPGDIPACPEGGCHCGWFWIHADDAGSEQMYMLGYKCNVTGATGTTPIPPAKTANKCDYPTDTSNCTVGPKQPHYWFQAERNNNPQGQYDPPFYNGFYGFMNGGQTDLFATASNSSNSSSPSSVPVTSTINASASSTVSSSVTASSSSTTVSSTSTSTSSSSTVSSASTPASSATLVVDPVVSSSVSSTFTSAASSSTAPTCKRRKRSLHGRSTGSAKRHKARLGSNAERQVARGKSGDQGVAY